MHRAVITGHTHETGILVEVDAVDVCDACTATELVNQAAVLRVEQADQGALFGRCR